MYPILTYSLQDQWCSNIHCQLQLMLKPNSLGLIDLSYEYITPIYTTPKLASFPSSLPEWWQRKVPWNEATPKTTHSFNMSHWEQVATVIVYSFIKISKLAVTPTELKPDITMHHSQPITVEERLCQICPCGTVQNFFTFIFQLSLDGLL